MAGIQLGSSFRLSSPVPHLANASFPDAPTRLAAGQLRHVSWRYSQDSPDAHYRIKPLAVCFLADGVTAATQFGTWGTLEAHWRIVPISSDDLPESATPTNKYYTDARSVLKADLVNGIVPASQLPPVTASTALAQATATTLGTVRGNGFTGATGNVIVNTDGSMTAPAATTSAAYTLPQAAANTLGGLKLGANLALNTTSGQVDAAATFLNILGQPSDNANLTTALGLKVDKVTGLALSSNDYTSPEKAKLATLTPAAPLYGTTGINTDGAMTQAATTTLTGLSANLVTADKSNLVAAVNEVSNNNLYQRGTNGGTVVLKGDNNSATNYKSAVVAGESCAASGGYTVVVGGYQNAAGGNDTVIVGGRHNATYTSNPSTFGAIIGSDTCVSRANNCFISNSSNCSIAVGCDYTTLIGCSGLTITTGTNQTYINNVLRVSETYSVLPPLPSITIDFNAETVRTLTIATAGAVTFTGAANIALLKTKELYISNTSGAAIALSFTGGWSFFPGPAPTSLAAGKQAVLTLRSLGTTDATIKAAYVAQA